MVTVDDVTLRQDGALTVGPPDDGRPVGEHLDELIAAPRAKQRRSLALTVVTDSELQTWRSCHLKHHFQYRERLRPKVEAKALAIGSIFHTGMRAGLSAGWSDGWKSRPDARSLLRQPVTTHHRAGRAQRNHVVATLAAE